MQDLKGNIEMSIQRKVGLKELDVFGPSPRSSPALRRKKEPEKPPEVGQAGLGREGTGEIEGGGRGEEDRGDWGGGQGRLGE